MMVSGINLPFGMGGEGPRRKVVRPTSDESAAIVSAFCCRNVRKRLFPTSTSTRWARWPCRCSRRPQRNPHEVALLGHYINRVGRTDVVARLEIVWRPMERQPIKRHDIGHVIFAVAAAHAQVTPFANVVPKARGPAPTPRLCLHPLDCLFVPIR